MRKIIAGAVLIAALAWSADHAQAATGPGLTPAQQQYKNAVCLAFNQNATAPIAQLTRPQMAAGCPEVAV